jgi:hypothetical protein
MRNYAKRCPAKLQGSGAFMFYELSVADFAIRHYYSFCMRSSVEPFVMVKYKKI